MRRPNGRSVRTAGVHPPPPFPLATSRVRFARCQTTPTTEAPPSRPRAAPGPAPPSATASRGSSPFPPTPRRPDAETHLAAFLDHAGTLLAALGFTLTRTEAEGRPFLIARRVEDPGLPTILSYSHGDTVPGMEGRWRAGRDPWTLTEAPDEGRLYGRGIADNKGQFWVNLSALKAVLETRGRLGFNVTWLIEMGEEIGSPGLGAVIAAHRDLLAADLLLASDGPRLSAETPTIFLGARGGRTFRLHLKRRAGGRHSGNFGGLLRNPGLEMAHALTTISGPEGAVLVPGWTPAEVDPASRALLDGVTPAAGEIDAGWGTPGLTPAERVYAWCSAEILAFTCGDPAHPVNAIPPEATAWVQLRHVTGLEPEKLGASPARASGRPWLRRYRGDGGWRGLSRHRHAARSPRRGVRGGLGRTDHRQSARHPAVAGRLASE
jgi:acetylornithine deacetylase/succinyl-diaminopimelate desuccinylase-like protein